MAFNDTVAATLANGSNDAAPAAPAPSPAAPDISAPSPASTAPATAPTVGASSAPNQPAQPAQPEPQPPALIHPAHRSMFGALASALIGGTLGTVAKGVKAAAGPAPVDYSVDSSGKTVATPRPDTTASRLQRLAEAALMGLAYGAQAGPQKSAAASWAAGLGAGAQGQMQQAQSQDLLKRQQAQQNFESQEKAKTENAIRAMHRATTYSLWQKNMAEQNDHDPERAKNMDIVNAAQDYIQRNPSAGMSVEFVTDAQAKAIHDQEVAALKGDPTHQTRMSVMLPIGMTEAKDENGNPLYEQDGETPRQVGRIAIIKGGDKMPLPQTFVDNMKEYGKVAGINGADSLNAGQEVPITQFLTMDARLNQAKQKESDGWKPANGAHVLKRPDGTEVVVNGFNGKTREATPSTPGGAPSLNLQAIQNELNKGVTGERASEIAAGLQTQIDDPANVAIKPTLQKLQTQANAASNASLDYDAKRKQREADAEARANEGDLSSLKDMALHYEIEPDKLFPRFKGAAQKQAFVADMHRSDPEWSEANYRARFNTVQDFSPKGKSGQQVESLNTFTRHTGDANDLIQSLRNKNSPWLNKPMNKVAVGLGNDTIQPFQAALEAAKDEYLNFLKAGHAPMKEELDRAEQIISPNSSPAQIQATLRQMARTVVIRAESLNHQYRATMRKDYADMLTPESAQVLRNFGIDIGRVGGVSGEVPQQPKTQQFPAGATHIVPGPDGKKHYTNADGTKDFGVVQ